MKSSSINLCHDITREDAQLIKNWLKDHEITEFLNESPTISEEIDQVLSRIRLPSLTFLFNQRGRLIMIYSKCNQPIGFIKLVTKSSETEIVIVIGNKKMWGQGYGTTAIRESIKHAFFEMRTHKVVAKIHIKNKRSVSAFRNAGFSLEKEINNYKCFSITMEDFIKYITNKNKQEVE